MKTRDKRARRRKSQKTLGPVVWICIMCMIVVTAIPLSLTQANADVANSKKATENNKKQLSATDPGNEDIQESGSESMQGDESPSSEEGAVGSDDKNKDDKDKPGSGKYIAISFDDGPGQHTDRLLDELAKRDIKATFFVMGERVSMYEKTVKRAHDEGHEVANHTYDHKKLAGASKGDIEQQIKKTNEAVEAVTGWKPRLLRPSGGFYDETVMEVCKEQDMAVVLWTVDTKDWKNRNIDDIMKEAFQEGIYGIADNAIILMHDIYETSVDASLQLMDKLLEDGYTFLTVSQLLERKNGALVSGQVNQ